MRTIQREIVGAFIFSKDQYILLGKSRPGGVYSGCFIIPGGGVEAGETLEQALVREVREETGLDIRQASTQLVNTQDGQSEKTLRESGERVMVAMHFYDFRVDLPLPASSLQLLSEDDFADPHWLPTDQLAGLEFAEPCRKTLEKLGYL